MFGFLIRVLIFILGILAIAGGIFLIISKLYTIQKGVKAHARIVGVDSVNTRSRVGTTTTCFPTVVYHVDGKQYETEIISSGKTFDTWNEGDIVEIYYRENNPEKVVMKKGMVKWCFSMLFLALLGAIAILFALTAG